MIDRLIEQPIRGRSLLACVLLMGLFPATTAFVVSAAGQDAELKASTAAAQSEFKTTVYPVLAAKCMTCHNDGEVAGDFSMEPFADPAVAAANRNLWAKAHDKVASGKMPPASGEPLTSDERTALMGWIERHFGLAAVNIDPTTANPGRVTARRLNRVEYNNTIRDLLGVALKPADEFPVDDSGYGFDNIGDVLSISPMLMEKYMRAARTVSTAAVSGEPYPAKPTRLAKIEPKKDQDDSPHGGTIVGFALRGTLDATYHFPVEAEYEFRWRHVNLRGLDVASDAKLAASARMPPPAASDRDRGGNSGRGGAGTPNADPPPPDRSNVQVLRAPPNAPTTGGGRGRGGQRELTPEEYQTREQQRRLAYPPVQMVFTIDGAKKHEYPVEGNNDYDYSRGETIVRAHLTAGDHVLRISWPQLADMADPTAQYGNDGRRRLFIDYLDIHGPFKPSASPPASFKQIFVCGEPGAYPPACARQIIERLVTRAYRRPATPAEVQRLLSLVTQVQKQDSFEEGIRVAIEAVLMSPNFLYRIERDR